MKRKWKMRFRCRPRLLPGDMRTTAYVVIYEHWDNITGHSPSCCEWFVPNTFDERSWDNRVTR
jgi:hypothetical protein